MNFTQISQDEYKEIDFVVMGHAYAIQNEMGRLFDEAIYRNELKNRLSNDFENVATEVPIEIAFGPFSKNYYADLVVESKLIYELKAASAIATEHRLQLLQYLLLTGQSHGKLVNFGSAKVTGEYVSTTLDEAEQRRLSFKTDSFLHNSPEASDFFKLVTEMLEAWGGFLNLEIYYAATEHLLGGFEHVVRPIPVFSKDTQIGFQKAHLLSESSAYKITGLSKNIDDYRSELVRFLSHTRLESIEWVNLNKHEVSFETLVR